MRWQGRARLQYSRAVRARLQRKHLSSLGVNGLREIKRPQQLRRDAPQVALGEMNAGTDASASAVVVVVLRRPVGAPGVVVGELGVVHVAVGVEFFRVGVDSIHVVDGLDGDEKSGVFGDEHSFVFII